MLKWVAKRLKHAWSKHRSNNDTSRWASVARMRGVKYVWYGCPNEQSIADQTREQKKCFKLYQDGKFGSLQIYQTQPITMKHDETAPSKVARPNGEMLGHQTFLTISQTSFLHFPRRRFWWFIIATLYQLRPRPHVYGYFRIRNFFVADTATVHTYTANSTANP